MEKTTKLQIDIMEDRYGKPLIAALHLCLELETELSALKQELQALREQKPTWWHHIDKQGEDIFLNMPFELGDETPMFAAPMPAREGWKLVPIEPTEEMLEVYRTWQREGLQYMDIGIIKAIIEAAPKEPS